MFAALGAVALAAAFAIEATPKPNPAYTPGAVNTAITQANIATTICVDGYTAKPGVRHVTTATKEKVFAEYGVSPKVGGPYEVDHLVSLELGGSNEIGNLWPQSYTTQPYNAHTKDDLEDKLHRMVCSGQIPLLQAQHEIATDWLTAWHRYVEAP